MAEYTRMKNSIYIYIYVYYMYITHGMIHVYLLIYIYISGMLVKWDLHILGHTSYTGRAPRACEDCQVCVAWQKNRPTFFLDPRDCWQLVFDPYPFLRRTIYGVFIPVGNLG